MNPKSRSFITSQERESGMKFAPILPLLSAYGGSLHAIEMRLREIKQFLPDATEQSADDRIDAALKILTELLRE
jgi:hypothetical protein